MTPPQRLLQWYKKYGRDLPWRNTTDPYRILVSEIMLQQTQVDRVISYYKKWFEQFPTWETLANASNAEVIHAWAGLGYNRRGLMLRDIARQVVENGIPDSEESWMKLKGIGPYTAAALAVFSLHERTLPIDTNIRRVLDRVLLGIPFPDPKNDEKLKGLTDTILPKRGNFFDIPQALFDLATSICTKTPDCARCPLRDNCKAAPKFLSGKVRAPKAMIKKVQENRHQNKRYPDRIYRGRILHLIRKNSEGVDIKNIGPSIDKVFDPKQDAEWIEAMIQRLEKDQFVRMTRGKIYLSDK